MSGAIYRCGGCHFAKLMPQDFTARICYGAPPQATFTPSPDGKSVGMRMVRPIVKISEEACSMYRGKDMADVARDSVAMQAAQQAPVPETKQ